MREMVEERFRGLVARLVLSGADTRQTVGMVELRLQPRRLVPPHRHVSEDEISYVHSGEWVPDLKRRYGLKLLGE